MKYLDTARFEGGTKKQELTIGTDNPAADGNATGGPAISDAPVVTEKNAGANGADGDGATQVAG